MNPEPEAASDHPLADLLSTLRNGHFPSGIRCPRCGERRHVRWGSFSGRQRYRCASCRRTYSDLTGTPAAYAKKLHLWPEFASLLADTVTVRHAARLLGVHPTTTFRWRHAILHALVELDDEPLADWIEIASQRFTHSEKGCRHLRRPPRRRGYRHGPSGDNRTVRVLAAADRHGHYVSVHTAGTTLPPDRTAHHALLWKRVGPSFTVLARGGRLSAAARTTKLLRGTFRDARPAGPRPPRGIVHIETVRACIARLQAWLRRFRGVATRYLRNYLLWHREWDRSTRCSLDQAALRWPTVRVSI